MPCRHKSGGATLINVPLKFKVGKGQMQPAAAPLPHNANTVEVNKEHSVIFFLNHSNMYEVNGRIRVDWNPQLKKSRLGRLLCLLIALWSVLFLKVQCADTSLGIVKI